MTPTDPPFAVAARDAQAAGAGIVLVKAPRSCVRCREALDPGASTAGVERKILKNLLGRKVSILINPAISKRFGYWPETEMPIASIKTCIEAAALATRSESSRPRRPD
jgi:hypothetical protein